MQTQFVSTVFLVALAITSCSNGVKSSIAAPPAVEQPAPRGALVDEGELLRQIEAIARRVDGNFEDGWICGRNARVLKSGYARVAPAVKAEFALAYRKMLEEGGENMASDINTYIPYSKRAGFALSFWQTSIYKDDFAREPKKKKVQWLYESLLDGGELFWRGFEMVSPGRVNSALVLAHYKEQDMVFNYMEDEKTPGSFSDQYTKWKDSDKTQAAR